MLGIYRIHNIPVEFSSVSIKNFGALVMESCCKKDVYYSRLKFLISLLSSIIFILNLYMLKKVTPTWLDQHHSQLPPIFWYNSIIIYFIGCLLILGAEKKYNIFGIIISFLNYYQIYLVSYMLGYFSYGTSDELTHIGEYKNIISSGHISSYNIYPATHHLLYSFFNIKY